MELNSGEGSPTTMEGAQCGVGKPHDEEDGQLTTVRMVNKEQGVLATPRVSACTIWRRGQGTDHDEGGSILAMKTRRTSPMTESGTGADEEEQCRHQRPQVSINLALNLFVDDGGDPRTNIR